MSAARGRWRPAAAAVLLATACSAAGSSTTSTTASTLTTSTTTTAAAPSPSTRTTVVAPACPPWTDRPVAASAAPITAALASHLDDPRLRGNHVGVSVWIDGLGEVLAHHPDDALLPASNQKLLTAVGVLEALPLDATLQTRVAVDPASGDIVLVAGGDPMLTTTGPHSLATLARAVRDAGTTEVRRVVVDASHFDAARVAPGWQDWHVPEYVGPMSALVVDDNRRRRDAAYLADPTLGNGELFRDQLVAAGITVTAGVALGAVPRHAEVVAALESRPFGDLLATMLLASDNEVAESLTREAGLRLAGTGSTPAGTAALERVLRKRCAPISTGTWADGSGLSRDDRRSARELRRLVQHARAEPWWPELRSRLPVAGRSGTLVGRFRGTAAEGRVAAKTGTIIGGSSLSGVVTTASGQEAVFSVMVNGPGSPGAIRALDELVVALAAS